MTDIDIVPVPVIQIQVVLGDGNVHLYNFSDVLPNGNPATIADSDLITAVARWMDRPVGFLNGYKVARPETGNIVIMRDPKYGDHLTRGTTHFRDYLTNELGITPDFADATNHPYECRCDKCLAWWSDMGKNPQSDTYGPFTDAEIEAYREKCNAKPKP